VLTLRQLRYLDALARHGHFGRAAEECAVSQPALSMQIRDLERELGTELVERRQGIIVLTEIGAEVARRAGSILSATRDLADCARHSGRVLSGGLRLGVIPTLAPYVLPRLLPGLHLRHPDLRLDLLETLTKTLVIELAHGTLDVILLALPIERGELETLALFDDRFLLAVPADDPLPERARVTARDVNARRLVLLEEGHCLRDQALSYCGERNDGETRLGATSLATVLQLVASGYGVTLLPEVAIDVEIRDERVKLLRFVEPQPKRSIGLAWRPSSPRKRDFVALGDIVVETLKVGRPQPCALRSHRSRHGHGESSLELTAAPASSAPGSGVDGHQTARARRHDLLGDGDALGNLPAYRSAHRAGIDSRR
jgi:LysR family transcriptional regulator, hydrogen peroxide-inducible genes activator